MDTKLYVGNLSYETTEDDLRSLFSNVGTVTSVTLIKDRDTGRSRGFAYVELSSQSEAEQAVKNLDGKALGNREIKVNIARPPEEKRHSYSNDYNRYAKGSSKKQDSRRNGGSSRRYKFHFLWSSQYQQILLGIRLVSIKRLAELKT
jgi:RNA recognition motif-containing protein